MRAKLITLASALLWAAAVLPFSARANEPFDRQHHNSVPATTAPPTAASLLLTDGRINEGPETSRISTRFSRYESSNLFIDYEQQAKRLL